MSPNDDWFTRLAATARRLRCQLQADFPRRAGAPDKVARDLHQAMCDDGVNGGGCGVERRAA